MRKNRATSLQSAVAQPRTEPYPEVPPPPGFIAPDLWEAGWILSRDETRAWRLVYRHAQTVTDHGAYACVRAVQYSDGSLEDVEILVNGAGSDDPLNSDQARELAAALLEVATEVDGWAE
ncbi:hypothetical protein [Mycobacterium colombiense]|uniref:hypothetical protein n=1 Tax=Mycobacterium colombiense TaxID=339268 RepID=UPI000A939941|nr:hypothetical protein [Mycobacterium colombiense]